jgi:alkanesulfonate monooxygenase SsuD/methylene tetrahydromethanopterin reductase-like flavin-dependent oxidoreductase (luciferase family)
LTEVKRKVSAAMDVGIGLPNTIPGTDGRLVVDWARRADGGPFSTLGVLDRLAYDSIDPFAALAAAAGVTERIGLATMIAIGPLRNDALLVKQAASVDQLSGGRLTLGLAVGARLDDYEAAGVEHKGRGPRLSEQLAALRDGDGLGVREDLRLLVGGMAGPAFARMARYADGYAHGGGPPRAFARAAASATSRSATRTAARRTCATTTPSRARSPSRSPPATSPLPARSATSCAATRRRAATS